MSWVSCAIDWIAALASSTRRMVVATLLTASFRDIAPVPSRSIFSTVRASVEETLPALSVKVARVASAEPRASCIALDRSALVVAMSRAA